MILMDKEATDYAAVAAGLALILMGLNLTSTLLILFSAGGCLMLVYGFYGLYRRHSGSQ